MTNTTDIEAPDKATIRKLIEDVSKPLPDLPIIRAMREGNTMNKNDDEVVCTYTYNAAEQPGDREEVEIGTAKMFIDDDGNLHFWVEGHGAYIREFETFFRRHGKKDGLRYCVPTNADERKRVADCFAAWNQSNRRDKAASEALTAYHKQHGFPTAANGEK